MELVIAVLLVFLPLVVALRFFFQTHYTDFLILSALWSWRIATFFIYLRVIISDLLAVFLSFPYQIGYVVDLLATFPFAIITLYYKEGMLICQNLILLTLEMHKKYKKHDK